MNRLKAGIVIAAAAFFLSGSYGLTTMAAESVAGLNIKEKETEAVTEAEDENKEYRSYLTGRLVEDETEAEGESEGEAEKELLTAKELVNKRPIAIMLNNIINACPQAGIDEASIVYEAPVEGSLTRLLGIFEDYRGMEKIGSVRSCRDYYIDFAKEFDAIYVHFGQAVYAFDKLNAEGTDNISGLGYQEQAGAISGYCGEDIFYRTSDRVAPHNVYIDEEGIDTAIERNGYRSEHEKDFEGRYQFAKDGETVIPDDGTALRVEPGYLVNRPWFEYDEEGGFYNRFQYDDVQYDQNNGNQLAYTNIIFQLCKWENYDANGYLKIDTQSGGTMYYFTKGAYEKGTWEKKDPLDPDSPAIYYDSEGNVLTMNQGKTWVCIIQDTYEDRIVIE